MAHRCVDRRVWSGVVLRNSSRLGGSLVVAELWFVKVDVTWQPVPVRSFNGSARNIERTTAIELSEVEGTLFVF